MLSVHILILIINCIVLLCKCLWPVFHATWSSVYISNVTFHLFFKAFSNSSQRVPFNYSNFKSKMLNTLFSKVLLKTCSLDSVSLSKQGVSAFEWTPLLKKPSNVPLSTRGGCLRFVLFILNIPTITLCVTVTS